MKNNKEFQENAIVTKVFKHSKKLFYLSILAGTGIFLNACAPGYVATEPTYVETVRPNRPSDGHIWIDGNWNYNHRSNTYVKKNGYWSKPYRSRVYVAGHWQSSAKGSRWVPGHWQGHSHMMNHVR